MKELSIRFNMSENDIKEKIIEAIDFFNNKNYINPTNNIKIWLTKISPLFAYYRFDGTCIITTYSHLKEVKAPFASFVFKKGGVIFNLFENEFENLLNNNHLTSKYS